jgi:large subunit ribosomal protein LP1
MEVIIGAAAAGLAITSVGRAAASGGAAAEAPKAEEKKKDEEKESEDDLGFSLFGCFCSK